MIVIFYSKYISKVYNKIIFYKTKVTCFIKAKIKHKHLKVIVVFV
ncbi:protein of unknown function [Tenacibaculum aestuariivivum]